MTDDEWCMLLSLPRWTRLADCPTPVEQVEDTLYQCGKNAFLRAVPHRADLVPDPDEGPFATTALWAASEGAARRVCLRQLEWDDGAEEHPPLPFLPPSTAPTYEALLATARASPQGASETASYRFVPDGAFLNRDIHAGPWRFCFRGRADSPEETPFVIERRLDP